MSLVIRIGALVVAVSLAASCSKPSHEEAGSQPRAEAQPVSAARPPAAEATPDPKRLYCKEHSAYEDECFFCHEELREKGRLWCEEHDRYEDRCFLCHPELQDKNRALCEKHFLYVDECFLCNPALKRRASVDPARLMCKEHGVPEDECGICHPELAAKIEPGKGLKVRFASPDAAAKAGVRTAVPQAGSITGGVECYAEIVFNQNKLAHVASPVEGIIQSVDVDIGRQVAKDAILATIFSAAIGEAVAHAILAQQTVERERKLRADRVSSEKDLQEAEAAHRAAVQQLKSLGFDNDQIQELGQNRGDGTVLKVRAPFAGEIVERNAVRGARVEPGKPLFTLVNRATMWAMLTVPEAQLAHVRVGQKVKLSIDAFPGQTFTGTLTWIATQLDERTRMARARAEVPNPDGVLRAQMFARARVITSNSDKAVLVPQSAVQHIEGRPFAFVKVADDLYEARPIRIGATLNGQLEVLDGVGPEELVVVNGGFLVKSQLLISRLGAGCVD